MFPSILHETGCPLDRRPTFHLTVNFRKERTTILKRYAKMWTRRHYA